MAKIPLENLVKLFKLQCPNCDYFEIIEKAGCSLRICPNCKCKLEKYPFKIECKHSERIKISGGKTICQNCKKVFDKNGNETSLNS